MSIITKEDRKDLVWAMRTSLLEQVRSGVLTEGKKAAAENFIINEATYEQLLNLAFNPERETNYQPIEVLEKVALESYAATLEEEVAPEAQVVEEGFIDDKSSCDSATRKKFGHYWNKEAKEFYKNCMKKKQEAVMAEHSSETAEPVQENSVFEQVEEAVLTEAESHVGKAHEWGKEKYNKAKAQFKKVTSRLGVAGSEEIAKLKKDIAAMAAGPEKEAMQKKLRTLRLKTHGGRAGVAAAGAGAAYGAAKYLKHRREKKAGM